jgi:hypothetical protein
MDWKKLDDKIVNSERYKFFQKHERLVVAIQGLIVISLLVGILFYVLQDRELKTQIAENCGYTTNEYQCVCKKSYGDTFQAIKLNDLNVTETNG